MQGLTTKIYEYLPKEALLLREEVFLGEQGFTIEKDAIDDIATHIVIYDCDVAVGVARLYYDNGFIVGRICVRQGFRGQGIGGILLFEAEKIAIDRKGDSIRLHAQLRAKEFYERYGYISYGDIEYEEWCEHIWMERDLKKR